MPSRSLWVKPISRLNRVSLTLPITGYVPQTSVGKSRSANAHSSRRSVRANASSKIVCGLRVRLSSGDSDPSRWQPTAANPSKITMSAWLGHDFMISLQRVPTKRSIKSIKAAAIKLSRWASRSRPIRSHPNVPPSFDWRAFEEANRRVWIPRSTAWAGRKPKWRRSRSTRPSEKPKLLSAMNSYTRPNLMMRPRSWTEDRSIYLASRDCFGASPIGKSLDMPPRWGLRMLCFIWFLQICRA